MVKFGSFMITITDLSTGWVLFTKSKEEGGKEILYMMLRKEWMHYIGIAFFLPPHMYVLCHVCVVLASFISVPSDLSHLCWKHLALKLNKERKKKKLGSNEWNHPLNCWGLPPYLGESGLILQHSSIIQFFVGCVMVHFLRPLQEVLPLIFFYFVSNQVSCLQF